MLKHLPWPVPELALWLQLLHTKRSISTHMQDVPALCASLKELLLLQVLSRDSDLPETLKP